MGATAFNDTRGQRLKQLLLQYDSLFYRAGQPLPECTMGTHDIDLIRGSKPVFRTHGRVSVQHRDLVEAEIRTMLLLGIIEPAVSSWSSPVMVLPKPDGSLRFVNDFKGLNACTIPDGYSVPNVKDILFGLQGMSVFSKFDLKHAYWCIALNPDAKHLTAFFVPGLGQFQYVRLPQGINNAPATFCRVMQAIVGPHPCP